MSADSARKQPGTAVGSRSAVGGNAGRHAQVGFGPAQVGERDAGRDVGSELPVPALEQPSRVRELNLAARPLDRASVDLAQYRVCESGRRTLPRALDQLHALVDRRVGRDAFEVAELVDSHPQRQTDLGVESSGGPAGIALDQVVELRLEPQHAEHDLRGETGVSGIESRGSGEKEIGGVAAPIDELKDVKGDGTGGRNMAQRRFSATQARSRNVGGRPPRHDRI